MRKNTARKWVHLLLDLLPVLIIPIFAIYTINHEPQDITIEREEYKQVDFNQLVQPIEVISNSTGLTYTYGNDYQLILNGTASSSNLFVNGNYSDTATIIQIKQGHKYLSRGLAFYSSTNLPLYFDNLANDKILTSSNDYNITSIRLMYVNGTSFNDYVFNFYLYDLTQMFGSGNEPSVSQFRALFPDSTYNFTLSELTLVNVGAMTYNNTDLGSQFVYALYKPVNDYFNMTHLFNFGDIYTWINNNMFSGNAPLPIFIVYNVIVYEFLIDLIFLIYSIFMFIIDFSSELLARCFSFSNKGGTR